ASHARNRAPRSRFEWRGETQDSRRHAERRGLSRQGERPARSARRRPRRFVLSRPRADADEADARAAKTHRTARRHAESGKQARRARLLDLRQGERHLRLTTPHALKAGNSSELLCDMATYLRRCFLLPGHAPKLAFRSYCASTGYYRASLG